MFTAESAEVDHLDHRAIRDRAEAATPKQELVVYLVLKRRSILRYLGGVLRSEWWCKAVGGIPPVPTELKDLMKFQT
ncbi:hypothetical protein MRX96_056318 [Rhipicephalus microplus]